MTIVYCQNDDCIYLDGNICICDSIFIDGVDGCVTEEINVEDDEFKEEE